MLTLPRLKWIVLILAFLLPLGFAFFTSHAWEDYYITLRSSRNLVEGNGLVFNPGERVHTFTSPLGVLVPAACTWIVGVGHEETALWLFRVFNTGCLVAAVWLIWRRIDSFGLAVISRLLLFGLILFDGKLIDFSINGMETAIMVLFTILLWSELESPAIPRWNVIAISVGGLMWTRPDAFILAGALLLPHAFFRRRTSDRFSFHWKPVLQGILLGGVIYLPWFAWAWWYYGSPVPNTIVAKSIVTDPVHFRDLIMGPWRVLTAESKIPYLYLPTYWTFGGWPKFLSFFAYILTIVGVFGWIHPRNSAPGRRASLSIFLGMFYLNSIVLSPWYQPPWCTIESLAVALAFDRVYSFTSARQLAWGNSALRIASGIAIMFQVGVFASLAWETRIQQRIIETNVRKDIGTWLQAHARPKDSIFMEPLGYIGYYSGLKTYDFPGLSAPEVVRALKTDVRDFAGLIEKFRPTWLALRPFEVATITRHPHAVLDNYKLERMWDATAQLDQVSFLPGREWSELDSKFLLFHRNDAAVSPSRAP